MTPVKTKHKSYFQDELSSGSDAFSPSDKTRTKTPVGRKESIGVTGKKLNFYADDDSSSSSTVSSGYEPVCRNQLARRSSIVN